MPKPDRFDKIAAVRFSEHGDKSDLFGSPRKLTLYDEAPSKPANLVLTPGGPDAESTFASLATIAPVISSIGVYTFEQFDIRGLSFVYKDGKIVDESDLIPSYVRHDVDRGHQMHLNPDLPIRPIDGTAIAAISNAHKVYGHWLLDILPKIWLAQKILGDLSNVKLILPDETPNFAIDILKEYFSDLVFINHRLNYENLRPDRVIVPSLPHNDHYFHPAMNEFISYLQSHPSTLQASLDISEPDELIYITRRNFRTVSTSYSRTIANEEAVLQLMLELGFKVVSPEDMSWPEQICLFSKAKLIVGEDGSALHNAIFSQPKTAVVCLNPANHVQISIAALRDQLIVTQCSPTEATPTGNVYRVDIERLRQAVVLAIQSTGVAKPDRKISEQTLAADANQFHPNLLRPNEIYTPKYHSLLRHAVILSSYIPDTEVAHRVGAYYIGIMRQYFSDCTIYVGINTGSSGAWRQMLMQSRLDIVLCEVPTHLTIDSDVAGFQAVLRTLRTTRANHDFYWFGHTKGASHQRFEDAEALRGVIEQNFWSRRSEVEMRCDPTRHGVFPALPMPASGPNDAVVAYLKRTFPNRYQPIGYVTTYTFFGLTGIVLRNFLGSADSRFFEQNLLDGTGISRYFFEGGFSWIADMAGFEPLLLRKDLETSTDGPPIHGPCSPDEFPQNQLRVAQMIESWRTDREQYKFEGWPIRLGNGIQLGREFHTTDDFYMRYPKYA